ncbi:MAG: hypothetical protein HXY50_11290, partial [Ignavibacteriaceae bacterium]|nr:hypothetical protein [Ignavibacteriaceae bacterium]
MKKILFTLVISLISFHSFGQNLKILSSPDFKETIRDIKFIDISTGWICLNKGMIYKTTDGGLNWFEQNTGTTKDLVKISFVNPNIGWSVTVDGFIYKTTNGGESWTELNYSYAVPGMVFSICDLLKFIDENIGFIIAGKLKQIYLLKTTDGGSSWVKKDSLVSSTARRWYDIDFLGSHGIMVGDKKDIQKYTTDLGETWTLSTAINDNFFRDLKYVKHLSATEIIAMGEGNEFSGVPVPIYKSFDGGINWVKKNQSLLSVYDRVKTAYFKDNLNGIGMGSDGFSKAFVVKTTDGGETWSFQVLDYAFSFQSMTGLGDFLFAVGTSSHLIYSSDFGSSWQMLNKKAYSSIASINFVNNKGYAVTRNGDVYFNNDGTGKNWEYLSQAGKNLTGAMCFLPNGKGFILKENHHIVKTTDNGQTWVTVLEPVNPSSRNLVGGIDFGDLNNGFAWFSQNDYGDYYVYRTSDGGETWIQTQQFAGPGYISGNLISFDANTAVVLAPDMWTQRTTDGGITWNSAVLNNFTPYFATKDFEDVVKIDENRAVAIGEKFICITTDKGANWNYIDHGLNNIDSGFYKIAFSSDTLGYVMQYDGTILKTTDFGLTWSWDTTYFGQYYFFASAINQYGKLMLGTSTGYILGEETLTNINEEHFNPTDFYLNQNYPNPFNPST